MIARIVPAVRLPLTASQTFDYHVPQNLAPAIVPGSVVVIPFAGRDIGGLVDWVSETTSHDRPLREIIGVASGLNPLPPYTPVLWRELAQTFATSSPRFVWAALPVVPKRAIAAGDVDGVHAKEVTAHGHAPRFHYINDPSKLSKEVAEVISTAKSGQVLVLVPTVYDVESWLRVIGQSATGYHSGLSTGEQYRIACGTNAGTIPVVIATKSGVFLPFDDLSVILIIHAGSSSHLQEDSDPRFDARVVAERLAVKSGAALHAFDSLPPLGMSSWSSDEPRVYSPLVHDLRDAAKRERAKVLISETLMERMDDAVRAGRRVLVLLNRRGVSTALVCGDCATVVTCPDCAVPLTAHADKMTCFACERAFPVSLRCEKCKSTSLKTISAGSKTIFELFKKRYPNARIAHVDRETPGAVDTDTQLVVGTTAVFRALEPGHPPFDIAVDTYFGAGTGKATIWSQEETARIARTLASHLKPDGELHLQCADLTARALVALRSPEEFIAAEIADRDSFGYPPSKVLVNLLGTGETEDGLLQEAETLKARVVARYPGATVLPPQWGRPKLFRGKYRVMLTTKWQDSVSYADLVQFLPAGWAADVRIL